tara:strand:+ start:766 stop:1107 length:342 start_codon:yes stop_codon:yes gene_type:complete
MAEKVAGSDGDLYEVVATALSHGDPLDSIDVSEFDHLLETSGMSAAERHDYLQDTWNTVVALIDFHWKHHAIQLALKDSGKLTKIDSECDIPSDGMIQSKDKNLTKEYKKAAQ